MPISLQTSGIVIIILFRPAGQNSRYKYQHSEQDSKALVERQ